MCKTLYELFTDEDNEQQLFHSIATVATLLLQLGEVGKQFRSGDSLPVISTSQMDSSWFITFEQLLASVLTESALVNYFEQLIDLTQTIERFRSRRLLRHMSSSPHS